MENFRLCGSIESAKGHYHCMKKYPNPDIHEAISPYMQNHFPRIWGKKTLQGPLPPPLPRHLWFCTEKFRNRSPSIQYCIPWLQISWVVLRLLLLILVLWWEVGWMPFIPYTVGWSNLKRKTCYTFHVVPNCCKTPIPKFHVLSIHLSQDLSKFWLLLYSKMSKKVVIY